MTLNKEPDAAGALAGTLAGLDRGGRCRVVRVDGEGHAADRLRELGFTCGTEVLFVRAAPLGDPLCFRLRGTELCLRRTEAVMVRVEPIP